MIHKDNGQKCMQCDSFTKKFIICECCKVKICIRCAINENYCAGCYAIRHANSEVKAYFDEKYKGRVKA